MEHKICNSLAANLTVKQQMEWIQLELESLYTRVNLYKCRQTGRSFEYFRFKLAICLRMKWKRNKYMKQKTKIVRKRFLFAQKFSKTHLCVTSFSGIPFHSFYKVKHTRSIYATKKIFLYAGFSFFIFFVQLWRPQCLLLAGIGFGKKKRRKIEKGKKKTNKMLLQAITECNLPLLRAKSEESGNGKAIRCTKEMFKIQCPIFIIQCVVDFGLGCRNHT